MEKPNFVLIMTDTQGTNAIGTYGRPELDTPNIDRLADEGVKFTRAYTTTPVCTPARASLFTGIYANKSGGWANSLPLTENVKSMGQRFHDGGYQTAYIGKWHLDGHDYYGTGECPEGWDSAYWYDGRRYMDDLGEEGIALWRTGLKTIEQLRVNQITAEFTWANRISNGAIDFLEEQSDKPFLLVVSYDEPHAPFTCPPDYVGQFETYDYPLGSAADDSLRNKPAHHREWAETNIHPIAVKNGCIRHPFYFGCNSFVDSEIGRVLDAVKRYAPENTYIIFTSDHGDMLGAHQLSGKGPVMYEEITQIPLIIKQPDQLEAGAINDTLVSHIDLLPTMLDLAGLEIPPALDGESMLSLLAGQQDSAKAIFLEFNRFEISNDSLGGLFPIRCMISGRYKLVINLFSTDELYDLDADPAELDNLIDKPDYVEVRNDLHHRLLDWMNEKRDPFRGPQWERRPWQESRRLQWWDAYRHIPRDGYIPEIRDYFSGQVVW